MSQMLEPVPSSTLTLECRSSILQTGHECQRVAPACCPATLLPRWGAPGDDLARASRSEQARDASHGPERPTRRPTMNLTTAHTPYLRRHIDLSLTASDLCQRMPGSVRPTPLTDLRSNHDSRPSTHVGLRRHRPVRPDQLLRTARLFASD